MESNFENDRFQAAKDWNILIDKAKKEIDSQNDDIVLLTNQIDAISFVINLLKKAEDNPNIILEEREKILKLNSDVENFISVLEELLTIDEKFRDKNVINLLVSTISESFNNLYNENTLGDLINRRDLSADRKYQLELLISDKYYDINLIMSLCEKMSLSVKQINNIILYPVIFGTSKIHSKALEGIVPVPVIPENLEILNNEEENLATINDEVESLEENYALLEEIKEMLNHYDMIMSSASELLTKYYYIANNLSDTYKKVYDAALVSEFPDQNFKEGGYLGTGLPLEESYPIFLYFKIRGYMYDINEGSNLFSDNKNDYLEFIKTTIKELEASLEALSKQEENNKKIEKDKKNNEKIFFSPSNYESLKNVISNEEFLKFEEFYRDSNYFNTSSRYVRALIDNGKRLKLNDKDVFFYTIDEVIIYFTKVVAQDKNGIFIIDAMKSDQKYQIDSIKRFIDYCNKNRETLESEILLLKDLSGEFKDSQENMYHGIKGLAANKGVKN